MNLRQLSKPANPASLSPDEMVLRFLRRSPRATGKALEDHMGAQCYKCLDRLIASGQVNRVDRLPARYEVAS